MSIRFYFTILFFNLLISAASVLLLWFNMNPVNNPQMAFSLLGLGLFIGVTSFLIMFLFIVKKIYYRGDVNISTMNSSIRQGILLSLGGIFMGMMHLYHIQEVRLIWTVWITVACIEVMFQAIE